MDASPSTYRNASGSTQLVTVGGSGITRIELAPDGTTFTTTRMTQGMFTLVNGAAVRVTYSSTAPTIKTLIV